MADETEPEKLSIQAEYYPVLVTIYSVVLICGTVSIALMFRVMKCRASSTTSISVFYLMAAHFLFLLTVPFRIYYYSTSEWNLGQPWCKVVSSLIHVHMYTCLVFYVIIIVSRLKLFYWNSEIMTHSKFIPLLVVVSLSVAAFIVVIVIIWYTYGTSQPPPASISGARPKCFEFGKSIEDDAVKVLNYVVSIVVITVTLVLTALQVNVLRILNQQNGQESMQQLDHGVQQKSLLFALIMLVCFVPYHVFRLHYLSHLWLENVNEVFLSLTTFNCLDLLTILGGRSCKMCLP